MSKKKWFYLVVALQALCLAGMAGASCAADWLGQEIRLKTVPVDPRDVLYGDYVILSYSMSHLDTALWRGEDGLPEAGTPIYTLLREENGFYEPVAAYPDNVSASEANEVVLKGIVQYSWDEAISVNYGLERYYVPEGTGKALEEERGRLIVTVKVAPWGQTRITGVDIED